MVAASPEKLDVILVGGGLANNLVALRLAAERPQVRVAVLEQAPAPDHAHTWCFFQSDVSPAAWSWLRQTVATQWPGYSVGFPEHARRLSTRYACVTSASLQAALAAARVEVRHGAAVEEIRPDGVRLRDGRRLAARLVIDGRGARPSGHLRLAWQKFVGLEVRLKRPHGLTEPVVMDATVRQLDGFRFLYLLPFGADRLLVEDTRYSDGPELDLVALQAEALRYARGRGWAVAETLRRERGVLPVALGGDIEAFWAEAPAGVPQVGLRAALFHPTTGYSLPEAARTAELIAAAPDLSSAAIDRAIRAHSIGLWRRRGFYRALNRMLFLAAAPERRYAVLQRFYRLPQPLVERFYAGRLTPADKARILLGRPPVPLGRALAALKPSRGLQAHA
jgi:lycopene beta-cyclase